MNMVQAGSRYRIIARNLVHRTQKLQRKKAIITSSFAAMAGVWGKIEAISK